MSVSTTTLKGGPKGMVRAVGQHELDEEALWTAIDCFIKDPGIIKRRGPLTAFVTRNSAYNIGLAGTVAPDGTYVGVQLIRTTSPQGRFVGFKNSTVDITFPITPSNSPYAFYSCSDALGGGVLIGISNMLETQNASNVQALIHWRGAYLGNVSATPLAATVNVGATTVSLSSGGTSYCPGMFLFTSGGALVGVVKSVSGNTLTLEKPALAQAASTINGNTFRGLEPRVSKGRITTSASSTTVNGGDTRFKTQGLNSGTWDLFTPDYTFIGTVSAVASDTQLTLGANAAVALLNSDYIAVKRTGTYSQTAGTFGWLTALYAHHQFYARGKSLQYSDNTHPEAVYIGPEDDDTIVFTDDPITALIPTDSGLVVCSEREAHVLSGAVGTTPDRWRGDQLGDDGTFGPMSTAQYKGGAIWAGRNGIWYWGGSELTNIAGALGEQYHEFMSTVNSNNRVYGMVHDDHFFLHVEQGKTGVFAWYDANNTPNYLTRLTFAINLNTGAITILRNLGIRGVLKPPASANDGETYYAVSKSGSGSVVLLASDLFNTPGNDTVQCDNDALGPDMFIETKKYDFGDAQRLKLLKLFLLHYKLNGTVNDATSITNGTADHIRFATVKGMDDAGTVSNTKLFIKQTPNNGQWQDKRVKFMKRSQYLSIRIWEGTSTITELSLGAWAFGYKFKRPGRV